MAVKQSRPFDALFDTTYTVSGARDHYKQQGQAGFVLQKVPEHNNFFSDLQHYPASTFRIKASQQLPASVDRSFHPHERVPQLLKWQSTPGQISGPHMFKFFRRPLLPAGASLTLPLRLAPQQPVQQAPPPPPEPATKDAGTQSDYRESEAQTLPWSPDWVPPTNPAVLAKQAALCAKFNIAGPEVLQLAHLTFGNGLPGGLQEVRRLEKLRVKRAFEASLPPIDDVARLPERQAMIEAWEVQEWVEREEEIKGVQEERLELLAQALQVREEEIEAAHREQVQRRSAGLLASKANKFAAIHTERLKTFRQLAAAKDKVTGTLDRKAKSSIIQQYADYGSALYAPPLREGHFPDVIPAGAATAGQLTHTAGGSTAQHLHPAMFAPSTIAGLTELEASLPKKVLRAPQPATQQHTLTYKQRTEAAVQQDVETIHDMLQAAKAATGTRGIGKVWPCPLDEGPASAAVLAAAAAAATEGHGSSRHGLRSAGGKSSAGGSLAVAAAAAAAATAGASGRPVFSAKSAAVKAGASSAAASQGVTEAPPLPDPEGKHAALVLLQRLLRGRAVQNQMYAGKESRLLLIRELRLGLEGTGGCQPRPKVRDAGTQERDAAAGAALCCLCCLLASDDQEAIAQVLLAVAEGRQKQEEQQQLCQQQPMQQAVQEQEQQQVEQQELQSVDEQQQQQQEEEEQQQQQDSPEQASDAAQGDEQDTTAAELLAQQEQAQQQQEEHVEGEEQQQQDEQQQQQQQHEAEEQEAGQVPAQLSDPQLQPAEVEAAMQLNASAGELSAVSTIEAGGVGSGVPADVALPTAALSASDDAVEDAAAGAPVADVADGVDAAVVE